MPAETVPMPPPPFVGSASFWKAVMMPTTVPKRLHERRRRRHRRQHGEAAAQAGELALLHALHRAVDGLGDVEGGGLPGARRQALAVLGDARAHDRRDGRAHELLVEADRLGQARRRSDERRERLDVEARQRPAPAVRQEPLELTEMLSE